MMSKQNVLSSGAKDTDVKGQRGQVGKKTQWSKRVELGVCDVRLLETKCHRTDETLVLWWLAREAFADKGGLGHKSLVRVLCSPKKSRAKVKRCDEGKESLERKGKNAL